MTPQQLVGLALRLTSIWLALLAWQLYALTVSVFDFIKEDVPFVWMAVAVLPVVLGVFLWMFPMLVAQKLLPRAPDNAVAPPPIQEAAAVAVVVLGIWATLQAVPAIFSALSISIIARDTDLPQYYLQGEPGATLIASIVRYGIGVCLLCMPRLIARRIFPTTSLSAN